MATAGSDDGPTTIERLDRLWRARRDGHPVTDDSETETDSADPDEAGDDGADERVVTLESRRRPPEF